MKRRTAALADGRAIHYYATTEAGLPDATDGRDLDPFESSGELRFDALNGTWVAIAAHRQTRTHLPAAHECPLCPTTGTGYLSEIPASDYEVVVFDNRFPSLSAPTGPWDLAIDGIHGQTASVGSCEVVCFSADHTGSFVDLGPERTRLVIDVWADRTAALHERETTAIVFPFENRGKDIGVTLHHPHGQIYAYPFLPHFAVDRLEQARRFQAAHGTHLYDAILERELRDASRVLIAGEHWVAYVPFAARWPYEVHLTARRHVPDFPSLTDDERDELATIYPRLLRAFDRIFDAPMPYIAGWHQAPTGEMHTYGRLHLQLLSPKRAADKFKMLAGSEVGMGAFINDIAPEAAAATLRDLLH